MCLKTYIYVAASVGVYVVDWSCPEGQPLLVAPGAPGSSWLVPGCSQAAPGGVLVGVVEERIGGGGGGA